MERRVLIVTTGVVASAGVIAAWMATGREAFTKSRTLHREPMRIDPQDPLAQASFDEGASQTRLIRREGFRLGLLPAPQRLADRHALSVIPLLAAIWMFVGVAVGLARRCQATAYRTSPRRGIDRLGRYLKQEARR